MVKLGLTGGIGSGKSTVAQLFELIGVPVFYADSEAKLLMKTDVALKKEIIAILGVEAYGGLELNREYIAQKIFANPALLSQLNGIVHPAVRAHFEMWCADFYKSNIVVQEAAVLFENGSHRYFDKTILVTAPELVRIDRVMNRDGLSEKAVRDRIANQWTDDQKKQLADFVIYNNNEELLIVQLKEIIKSL